MNRVIIQGNLGGEPDFKSAEGKTPVCTFNVATHERSRNKSGEAVDITEWHRVVTFGRTAELCSKYLRKGDSALIEGKIRSSKWKDKEGKDQLSFRIVGDSVRFLSKKPSEVPAAAETATSIEEEGEF